MGNRVPESARLRGGREVYRFADFEIFSAGCFGGKLRKLEFQAAPDDENPQTAQLLRIGTGFSLKLEDLNRLRICVGGRSFVHPFLLAGRFFSTVAVVTDGRLIKVSVNGHDLVVSGGETLSGEVVFGGGTGRSNAFRGYIGGIVLTEFAETVTVPVPPEEQGVETVSAAALPQSIDLAGEWDFVLVPGDFSPEAALPDSGKFTAKMAVPGYWDDHTDLISRTDSFDRRTLTNPRYRPLTYPMGTVPPDATMPFLVGSGYYSKKFRFAPEMSGQRVILNVGPAIWGCTVFCNGKIAGQRGGYSTGTRFELTELLDFSAVNTVVIVVSNYDRVFNDKDRQENSQHIGLAVRGYQGIRGGIGGYCTLEVAGKSRIADAFADFDGETLHCSAEVSGAGEVKWSVSDATGNVLKTAGGMKADISASGLELWSDENPVLYRVTATLEADGKTVDRNTFRCGLRTLSTAGAQIKLNDVPVYLRGTTEHHYFPETGNAPFDKEKYLKDLRLWRSLGFNFLRFHTWCPPEPYLEAADECGMICQIEVPPHVSEAEWEAILRMIRRHASACLVCGGNEEDFTEFRINEVRSLARWTGKLYPGVLFNPQEALSKVEYRLAPDEQETVTEPFIHNPRKMAELAEFSDVYGSYNWGYFSYLFTEFPGAGEIDRKCAVYGKPLLSHEIGIMGGWLDFENEQFYSEGGAVPPDMYVQARKHLTENGVFQRHKEFFRANSGLNNQLRKILFENIRSCRLISGYDFLGVNDAHWHRCGYPCGMTDEFGKLRPGLTVEDANKYNAPGILLADGGVYRALAAKSTFEKEISISYFDKEPLDGGEVIWSFTAGDFEVSGKLPVGKIGCGEITGLGRVAVTLPDVDIPVAAELRAELRCGGVKIANNWSYRIYPLPVTELPQDNWRECAALDDEVIDFVSGGGRVLLTGNFPAPQMMEKFQPDTTGRCGGHHGTIIRKHPLMENLCSTEFGGVELYELLNFAVSMEFSDGHLPFNPLIEYIPSFKMVRKKSPLCEFTVGKGRILMCGLRFEAHDPAAAYLYGRIKSYLAGPVFPDAPAVEAERLKQLIRIEFPDSGVSKTDEAWDPNVSGGKGVS